MLAEASNTITANGTASSSGVAAASASFASIYTLATSFLGPDWFKLVVLGGALETIRRTFSLAWGKFVDSFFLTVEINQHDKAYGWMMAWLADQPAWRKPRDIEIRDGALSEDIAAAYDSDDDEFDESTEKKQQADLNYTPGYGVRVNVWFHRSLLRVQRSRKELGKGFNSINNEILEIQMLTRSHKTLSRLLHEAKKAYRAQADKRVHIYAASMYNDWEMSCSRPRRPIESVLLDKNVKERLLLDARDFLKTETWYSERGIPWRRGYLLYGVPGSGKTSIIHALAGELKCDVYVLSLAKKNLDDADLNELVATLPPRSIALIEDIDAAFFRGVTRDAEPSNPGDPSDPNNTNIPNAPGTSSNPQAPPPPPGNGITLAGLLSAIDGVMAQEGRLLFATTNKYDVLDPALCRPGRFDVHIKFGYAEKDQIRQLFRCFFPVAKAMESTDGDHPDDQNEPITISSTQEPNITNSPPPKYSPARSISPLPPTVAPSASPRPDTSSSTLMTLNGSSLPTEYKPISKKEQDFLSQAFCSIVPGGEFSMASLQGLLMQYKADPCGAVERASSWVQEERQKKQPNDSQTTPNKDTKSEKEELRGSTLQTLMPFISQENQLSVMQFFGL